MTPVKDCRTCGHAVRHGIQFIDCRADIPAWTSGSRRIFVSNSGAFHAHGQVENCPAWQAKTEGE